MNMRMKWLVMGMLSAAAATGFGERGPRGFVEHLDKDDDGRVSAQEFDGPAEHFTEMDKNGDGYVSGDEAPKGPPDAASFVKHLDKDGDNRVSAQEFDGPPEHFSRFDENDDGFIVESEAPKGPPPGGCGGHDKGHDGRADERR